MQKLSKIDNSKKVYSWNSRNQLQKVESFDGQSQLIRTLTFTYGPLGRRLSKSVNNQTSYYLYDAQSIVAILDENQQVISTLVHSEYIDTPLSITTYDQTYYYHRDHLGSILSLTNSSQTEVENYSYDAYGLTEGTQSEVTNNPYGYTGRELDDSDLYYYRARYYDPTTQRFLSEDPIGFLGGDYNFYRYVGGDPVNWVDPWGLERWWTGPDTVGRPGTFIPPGGKIGKAIQDHVGSGGQFGSDHDKFVEKAVQSGIPDPIINIPSMLPVYLYSVGKDLCEMPPEDRPPYFPLLEIRF